MNLIDGQVEDLKVALVADHQPHLAVEYRQSVGHVVEGATEAEVLKVQALLTSLCDRFLRDLFGGVPMHDDPAEARRMGIGRSQSSVAERIFYVDRFARGLGESCSTDFGRVLSTNAANSFRTG